MRWGPHVVRYILHKIMSYSEIAGAYRVQYSAEQTVIFDSENEELESAPRSGHKNSQAPAKTRSRNPRRSSMSESNRKISSSNESVTFIFITIQRSMYQEMLLIRVLCGSLKIHLSFLLSF